MNWKEKIKESIIQIIITIVIIPFLIWIGVYVKGIYQSVQSVPEVQKNLNEFMTDQAENNKMYNGMLYKINQKLHDDSIRNEKH